MCRRTADSRESDYIQCHNLTTHELRETGLGWVPHFVLRFRRAHDPDSPQPHLRRGVGKQSSSFAHAAFTRDTAVTLEPMPCPAHTNAPAFRWPGECPPSLSPCQTRMPCPQQRPMPHATKHGALVQPS